MYKSFAEIEKTILAKGIKKRVVLACAHDEDALSAVVNARRKGVVEATLVGRAGEIKALLSAMGESPASYGILENEGERESAGKAVALVRNGEADIPMKGMMQTANFMRAILDKEHGLLPAGALLSQATVAEYRQQERFLVISDCAVNIAPSLAEKKKIIANAVLLANKLGCDKPQVACVAPVEVENPKIQSTVDAAELKKAWQAGEMPGCVVDGPFALDNAVSKEAAAHKGVCSPVAGVAEVLLMPDLNTGNALTKSLTYFANLPSAGTLNGTLCPVVMTSRTDSPQNKYYSILVAILQSL